MTATTHRPAHGNDVPLPRAGSLFGWAPDGEVTVLVAFYGGGGPNGEPVISPMPHTGLPQAEWPPFTGAQPGTWIAGPWIWGPEMVDVGAQIAGTTGLAFWVPTEGALGAGCIGVTRYLDLPSGQRLLSGLYVYASDLAAGMALPDWPITNDGVIDLGPRFGSGS